MKKFIYLILSLFILGCSSEIKDNLSDAVWRKYTSDNVYNVSTGVYDLKIDSKKKNEKGGITYKVQFVIVEHHSSHNEKYKGWASIDENNGIYTVRSYDYK